MREKYINMRKNGTYDVIWFYNYYLENLRENAKPLPPEIFNPCFQQFLTFNANNVLDLLDSKFQVQKIEDEFGKIIYIA